jgi:hypothetical protein
MPTLSASDYTQYLKFKAAAASPIQQAVQTRSNTSLYQSVINANVLASQAAYVLTPALTNIQGNARVVGMPPNTRNTPFAQATLSYSGLSGALSSSRVQQPGGLPTGFKGSQNTYHRIPQNAGWTNGA